MGLPSNPSEGDKVPFHGPDSPVSTSPHLGMLPPSSSAISVDVRRVLIEVVPVLMEVHDICPRPGSWWIPFSPLSRISTRRGLLWHRGACFLLRIFLPPPSSKWSPIVGVDTSEPPRCGHHPPSKLNKEPRNGDKNNDQVYQDDSTDLLGLDEGDDTTQSRKQYTRHGDGLVYRQPDHPTRWSRKCVGEAGTADPTTRGAMMLQDLLGTYGEKQKRDEGTGPSHGGGVPGTHRPTHKSNGARDVHGTWFQVSGPLPGATADPPQRTDPSNTASHGH